VHWKSRHRKGYCAVSDTGYAVGYICYAVEDLHRIMGDPNLIKRKTKSHLAKKF